MIPLIHGGPYVGDLLIIERKRTGKCCDFLCIRRVRHDYDSSGESGITSYYVFVGKKKFTFGDEMSAVFKEGEKYKFYYCKAGLYEFVMSYERLSG